MSTPLAAKTYNYLRLAMVALVVLLASSLLIEMWQTSFTCYRTSISSYYFTPVRGVFVGVLVAIGVCLIVLKGNTDTEDVLLNVAGVLAPVVAFVPISDPGECQSTPVAFSDARPNIANNVGALIVTGLISLVVVLLLAKAQSRGRLPRAHILGLVASSLVSVAGIAWFAWGRTSFERWAHYAAAIPLFVILMIVMVLNAASFGRAEASRRAREPVRADFANRYAVIAAGMSVGLGCLGLVGWLGPWQHWLFWGEALVIAAFAAFWVVQTQELWQQESGLRPAGGRNARGRSTGGRSAGAGGRDEFAPPGAAQH